MAASWAIAAMVLVMFLITLPVAIAYTPAQWHRVERADGRPTFTPYKSMDAKLHNIRLCLLTYQTGMILVFMAFLTRAFVATTSEAYDDVSSLIVPAVAVVIALQVVAVTIKRQIRRIANSDHKEVPTLLRHH